MKLAYFGYRIHDKKKNDHFLHDLSPFIAAFSEIKDKSFKNKFKAGNDENIYLFNVQPNLYLFAMTKNNELVKKINKNTIKINRTLK